MYTVLYCTVCGGPQNPLGQINMRDARVEQVDHVSDSDSEDREAENTQLTIGIFPSHQGPTYLLMPTKQDKVTYLCQFIF